MQDTKVIIIIGAARSGTKFLRNVLAAGEGVSAIQYDVNYVWRTGSASLVHDEISPDHLNDDICLDIKKQLYRLSNVQLDANQIMLEKTVSNTLRVPFVNAVFPNALFVHLIRDGRAVTESSMRMWDAPPDIKSIFRKLREFPLSNFGYLIWFAKNFIRGLLSGRQGGQSWGPRYKGLEKDLQDKLPLVEICAKQWLASVSKARRDLDNLNPNQVFTLSYSELVGNEKSVTDLIDFLGIDDKNSILEYYRDNVRTGQDNKWKSNMTSDEISKMESVIGEMIGELGFDLTGNLKSGKGSTS